MRNNGLTDSELRQLNAVFKSYPEISNVIIYGSRAKGNYRDSSDIDLAIKGNGLDRFMVAEILQDLMETNIPYLVDLQDYDEIKNARLKSHIDRVGKLIYQK
jgi:predicted nucleotidyltransferase